MPVGSIQGYDAAGRRSQVTIAGQSQPLVYSFDNADRLISLTQGSAVAAWNYDAANRFIGVTLPNGVTSTIVPDAANEVSTMSYDKGSTHIADAAYGYDADGHRVSASGTLVRPLPDANLTGTSYDAGNHLTALASGVLTYDANGNLLTQSAATPSSYTWNTRNQLTGTNNGTILAYDALGRLVTRTQGGASTTFLYDGANQVAVNGNVMLRGRNLDEVETEVTVCGTINYLTDGLGSASILTDSSGNISTLYSYGAYGATASTGVSGVATVDTPFKYTGADYNSVDDLYYFRNRYYSSHLQRFISEDPVGFSGGVNMNAYVRGNPISQIDALGLWSITAGGYFGAGAELTVGFDAGRFFITPRLGFGIGGGISYDPEGGVPGGTESTGCRGGFVASASGKAGFGFGPFGALAERGIFNNFISNIIDTFSETGKSADGALDAHGGISVGVQVTLYTGSH